MGSVLAALAAVAEPARGPLQHVIDLALELAPEATEGQSYGMPALKLDDKPLIAVVAAAKHLSLYPFSGSIVAAVADQLEGYSLSKGTIRFSPEQPVPDEVIRQILQLRIAEIRG